MNAINFNKIEEQTQLYLQNNQEIQDSGFKDLFETVYKDGILYGLNCQNWTVNHGLSPLTPEQTKQSVEKFHESMGHIDNLLNQKNILLKIAQRHLGLPTLEARKSDRLDFKEQSVWSIKDALEAAYEAGKKAKE